MLSDNYERVPCGAITIQRDARQRRVIDTTGLKDSISRHGVMVPLIITKDYVLVAGERRLTSSLELGLPTVPCRFAEDLSPVERQIIELEENVQRSDLPWQDHVLAVGRLHALYEGAACGEEWSQGKTAERLGYSRSTITKILRVFEARSDPKVWAMPGLAAAWNFLARKDERGIDNALSMILETGLSIGGQMVIPGAAGETPEAGPETGLEPLEFDRIRAITPPGPTTLPLPAARPGPPEIASTILHDSFLTWLPAYSGPKFNFLHCDFPYGIDVFAGKQSGRERQEHIYEDRPEVFWDLLAALLAGRDSIMQASCHVMFWFSMDYYSEIFAFFRQKAPEFHINPFPLIWHKSDGSGITPDPQRGPKRAYETALLAYRGDRKVVRSVGNFYAAPTDKKYHHSAKPEPMLRQFFQLFVDEHTQMLDPTCGGGSSVRAAESLGAKRVLGIEKEKPFFDLACEALRHFRAKEAASKRG